MLTQINTLTRGIKMGFGLLAGLLLLLGASRTSAQTTNRFSFTNLNLAIPDGNGSGLSFSTNVTATVSSIANVEVRVIVAGQFNGDLYAYLRHVTSSSTNLCVLLNRPGRVLTNLFGYDGAGLDVTLKGSAANDIHLYGNFTNLPAGAPLTGAWQPDGRRVSPSAVLDTTTRDTSLSAFNGMDGSGEWTLFVADVESGGANTLTGWELQISAPNQVPTLAAISGVTSNEDSGAITVNLAGISAGGGESQTLTVTATSGNTDLIPNPSVTYLSPNSTGSLTFTPAANANGSAIISVVVTDGGTPSLSVTQQFTVTINAVNDAPSFTKGPNQTVNEDAGAQTVAGWAAAISVGPANESGQVVNFIVSNNSNSLFSAQPAIAANGTLTYTPATNAFGTATVTVQIHDDGGVANGGVDTSESQTFTITIIEVNDPPVAGADALVRSLTSGAKVLISNLLTNDFDPDGDAISFFSVSSTSANGGAVASNGLWILYTPLAGDTNVDTFTYTIKDSRGASGVGTVTVTPVANPAPSLNLTITDLTGGNYRIRFDGIPSSAYDVQTATALTPANWQLWVATNTDAYGIISLIDTAANGATNKFYRTLYK